MRGPTSVGCSARLTVVIGTHSAHSQPLPCAAHRPVRRRKTKTTLRSSSNLQQGAPTHRRQRRDPRGCGLLVAARRHHQRRHSHSEALATHARVVAEAMGLKPSSFATSSCDGAAAPAPPPATWTYTPTIGFDDNSTSRHLLPFFRSSAEARLAQTRTHSDALAHDLVYTGGVGADDSEYDALCLVLAGNHGSPGWWARGGGGGQGKSSALADALRLFASVPCTPQPQVLHWHGVLGKLDAATAALNAFVKPLTTKRGPGPMAMQLQRYSLVGAGLADLLDQPQPLRNGVPFRRHHKRTFAHATPRPTPPPPRRVLQRAMQGLLASARNAPGRRGDGRFGGGQRGEQRGGRGQGKGTR